MSDKLKVKSLTDLPDYLFTTLGRVVVYSGHIEYALALTIKRTTSLSWDAAHEKVQDLHDNRKIRNEATTCFNTWADAKLEADDAQNRKDDFSKLIARVEALFKCRADVVHCAWSGSDESDTTATRKGKLLRDENNIPFGVPQLNKLADKLFEVSARINELTEPDLVSFQKEDG